MPRVSFPFAPKLFPLVWFLPCNDTPFLNRNHPVFLAIRDRAVDVTEGRIRLEHFGWVTAESCRKYKTEAEEALFHKYEVLWIDHGLTKVATRSTLDAYCRHSGKSSVQLFWFDLTTVLCEDNYATP